MWNPLKRWFIPISDQEFQEQRAEILKQAPIPEIWLFGKTGSGKSSVIRYLTGAQKAEIGNGFRPQTLRSQRYSFPDEETPLVVFWDTRGLGEADYDESEDVQRFDDVVHLIVVVVRAMDHSTDQIVEPLRRIRRSNPRRPVLLVLTALHDAYPGQQHPDPDPFSASATTPSSLSEVESESKPEDSDFQQRIPEDLPDNLRRSLLLQLERFDGLFDDFVAVDLTPEEEGFEEPNFGGQRLKHSLIELLPRAFQQTMLQLDEMRTALGNLHRQKCGPVILAHSAMAASAAAMPIPWVDIPAILAIQSNLARKMARMNHQEMDAKTWAQVGGVIGGGQAAVQMGFREAIKVFVPWAGIAVNSASAFAITYATGWAWNWYFMERKWGHVPTTAEIKQQYNEQLQRGASIWSTSAKESE